MPNTGQGRSRRRRGRRGQRNRHHEPQQQQQGTEQPHETIAEAPPVAPATEQRAERRSADPQPVRDGGGQEVQQADRRGGRKRTRGKRGRTSKRPALATMPAEVLKERVRDVPVTGTMATQTLDEFSTPSGMTFGCPMLSRTRMGLPVSGGVRMPRCSMGWALHNEEEASFCMKTPDQRLCWKEHPEREAEFRGEMPDENAAD